MCAKLKSWSSPMFCLQLHHPGCSVQKAWCHSWLCLKPTSNPSADHPDSTFGINATTSYQAQACRSHYNLATRLLQQPDGCLPLLSPHCPESAHGSAAGVSLLKRPVTEGIPLLKTFWRPSILFRLKAEALSVACKGDFASFTFLPRLLLTSSSLALSPHRTPRVCSCLRASASPAFLHSTRSFSFRSSTPSSRWGRPFLVGILHTWLIYSLTLLID